MTRKIKASDVKVGSPEQAAWKTIADQAVNEIASSKRAIEMNEAILELAGRREREEEAAFKKDLGKV